MRSRLPTRRWWRRRFRRRTPLVAPGGADPFTEHSGEVQTCGGCRYGDPAVAPINRVAAVSKRPCTTLSATRGRGGPVLGRSAKGRGEFHVPHKQRRNIRG